MFKGFQFPVSKLFILIIFLALLKLMTQVAFAHEPPPNITFKGLNETGCKIFEIDDRDAISTVAINDPSGANINHPDSDPQTKSTIKRDITGTTYTFDYSPGFPGFVKLTVCPLKDKKAVNFILQAADHQARPLLSMLDVEERMVKEGEKGTFEAVFALNKPFANVKCADVKKNLTTDNLKKVDVKCESAEGGSFTKVTVTGELANKTKRGTAVLVVDPQEDIFLLVVEVVPTIPVPVFPGIMKAVAVVIVAIASFLLVRMRSGDRT